MEKIFECKDDFYMNGKTFRIISGAIHYFRVVPEYWRDRLEKLKAMGCNTVETYIPWNLHEPQKGEFCFEGRMDIERFVKIAEELGLYVILRPSPYICAEWEFGGLPGWLLSMDDIRLRTCHPAFLNAVRDYYDELMPRLAPMQITNGGPVIMMQIENEYGYFGNDTKYLEALKEMMEERGIRVPLFTSDGAYDESFSGGHVDGTLQTGNFGSHIGERFSFIKSKIGNKPVMCTEFWVGWFDYWGNGKHMTGNLEQSVKDLEEILENGHVNIYMFEGGTNFGFMNGSNYYDNLTPDVTSYDYDAVLTEDGQITEKYRRFQEVISKFTPIPEVPLTTEIKRKAYGSVKLKDKVSLFSTLDTLSSKTELSYTVSMEKLGQSYGYILYHSSLAKETKLEKIKLNRANDRANILLDQKKLITLYDRELQEEHEICGELHKDSVIDILVENMGRVNFGARMEEQRKGIDGRVQINDHIHHGWEIYPLPLDHIEQVDFSGEYKEGVPAFYRFELEVDETADTFLELSGFGKGCVFLNGFNLGRFWEIGPQKRLYVPAPLLREGRNEIIVFETEGKYSDTLTFYEEADLG